MVARSSQTKLGNQVGTLGEELLRMAFGLKLDADGLVGFIVPLGVHARRAGSDIIVLLPAYITATPVQNRWPHQTLN